MPEGMIFDMFGTVHQTQQYLNINVDKKLRILSPVTMINLGIVGREYALKGIT